MHTRRAFNQFLVAGAASMAAPSLFAAPQSARPAGVRIGLETYSLYPLPHEGITGHWIALMNELGLTECNLYEPTIHPDDLLAKVKVARDSKQQSAIDAATKELSAWRASLPISYFSDMRKKFDAAGIRFTIYTVPGLTNASTDPDFERACMIAKAIGAEDITTSSTKTVVKRFLPFIDKYNLRLGLQGRPDASATDPDAISKPSDYEEALGFSPRCSLDLDIGDATGGGFDILPFVKKNHARIYRLELKDRKRDKTSMPWGQGDTPVKDVLLYVRDNKLPIRCYIDCDYNMDQPDKRLQQIRDCRAYIHSVLGA